MDHKASDLAYEIVNNDTKEGNTSQCEMMDEVDIQNIILFQKKVLL